MKKLYFEVMHLSNVSLSLSLSRRRNYMPSATTVMMRAAHDPAPNVSAPPAPGGGGGVAETFGSSLLCLLTE